MDSNASSHFVVREIWKGDTVSLESAKEALASEIRRLIEDFATDAQNWKLIRIKVTVKITDLEDAILWLGGQPMVPKVFFSDPRQSLVSAGAGSAHIVQGSGILDRSPISEFAPAEFRYYGGQRFDAEAFTASEWSGFGGHFFVLPRLELVRSRDLPTNDCIRDGNIDCESPDSPFSLAVNVMSSGETSQAAVQSLHEALESVQAMGTSVNRDNCRIPSLSRVEMKTSFECWMHSIQNALDLMETGKLRKVVLSRSSLVHFSSDLHPLDLLLNFKYDNSYRFCLQPCVGHTFLSCSPERLFKIQDSMVETMALAGTRARGSTGEQDAALAAELLASTKDGRENAVTCEYIQKQLAAHSESISVSDIFILKLRHVQHLCRIIRARVKTATCGGGGGAADAALRLLETLSPTPAVCGDSRAAATAFIRRAEPFDRGFFAGPVGVLSSQSCEFLVAIRSALAAGRVLHVFAGAGIVPGSDPRAEWEETALKMRNVLQLIPQPAAPPTPNAAASPAASCASTPRTVLSAPRESSELWNRAATKTERGVAAAAAGELADQQRSRRPQAAGGDGSEDGGGRGIGGMVASAEACAETCAASVWSRVQRGQMRWLVDFAFCWCLGASLFRMNPALFVLF